MKLASLIFSSLFALAHSDGCGDWSQEPTSGRCFKCLTFYNKDTMTWSKKSFDSAEISCNEAGGRVLTSIHSKEENDFVAHSLTCTGDMFAVPYFRNIGLRCVGAACKWNDGSPVDYTNFYGAGPPDDGVTRCYTISPGDDGQWKGRGFPGYDGCPDEDADCWICGMPPQEKCAEGETAHKNGCVSVHLTPLDQKSAEESCPGGGHLVSIHGGTENNFYSKLAMDAGINGTVYIGGQFSEGAFEWTDGSHPEMTKWATSFPNTIYGSCVQMLLSTDFYAQGYWTNVDCASKQPYMCFRDGAVYGPTIPPPVNHTDPQCIGKQYIGSSGTIYSPNFPLSIPAKQGCEWMIRTNPGTKATIQFVKYDCQSGCTVSLYDGDNVLQPFLTFTSPSNVTYSASSNELGFYVYASDSPVGTGWEVQYYGI